MPATILVRNKSFVRNAVIIEGLPHTQRVVTLKTLLVDFLVANVMPNLEDQNLVIEYDHARERTTGVAYLYGQDPTEMAEVARILPLHLFQGMHRLTLREI